MPKRFKYISVVCCFLFQILMTSIALADHPTIGFGSGLSGPIVTIPAMTLPKNKWALGFRGEHIRFDTFRESEMLNFASAGNDIHDNQDLLGLFTGIAYGITDDITISARAPYILRTNLREGHLEDGSPEIHRQGNSDGIGDLSFFGQYRVFNNGGWQAALIGGLKTPTGETHERDRTGTRFETDHQPGSGSWDPLVGGALTREFDGFSLHANLLHTFATDGSQNTELGDLLNYNLSLVVPLNRNHNHNASDDADQHNHLFWDAVLELNGEHRGRDVVNGITQAHSGGDVLYISPGVRASFNSWLSAFIAVGVPLIDNPNGIQTDRVIRTLFGVSVSL